MKIARNHEQAEVQSVASKSQVFIKCGDCLHWTNSPHPSRGGLCKPQGVTKNANAPVCFTPNVHSIKWVDSTALGTLGSIVSNLNASESRVFVGLFRQQARLKRAGFSFLEQVYVLAGADYLSNYFAAFVLGLAPDGELLLVGSDYLNRQRNPVVFQMMPSSVIRESEFSTIRERLVTSGKIDPALTRAEGRMRDCTEYEIPTIETSPDLLEALSKKTKKKRKSPDASLDRPLEVDLSDL